MERELLTVGDVPLLTAAHVALAVVVSLHVLLHKHRPVSAVLWLGVLWVLPFVGALGYLMFGVDRVSRGASERETVEALMRRRIGVDRGAPEVAAPAGAVPEGHPAVHILRATDAAVRPYRVHGGNRAELLVDGDEFFPSLTDAIESAEKSIHLQTFIFSVDRTGRRIRDLLANRARDGLEVRLLYDRFGSTRAHLTGFFRPARRAGVRVASISQANPLKGRFQINLRNHRKVVVIDGRVGFVGGLNIDDRNLSEYRSGSPDRDYQVKLEGPVMADLQTVFAADWHYATREPAESLMTPACYPPLEPVGPAFVQVVPGAPEHGGKGLAQAFFAAAVSARESLDIVTPYFVPDQTFVEAVSFAAVRGVRVRLIVPTKSNHWYTSYATRALYQPLLDAGVRVFERGRPFMHAKALVADGSYAMLGSANLDYRSLHLNFELNVEISEAAFVRRLVDQIEAERARSREITLDEHRARPLPRRLLENFCFLFQPVL